MVTFFRLLAACFVIQCDKDNRSEVIQSLGHAFEAKYKDFMRKPLVAAEVPERYGISSISRPVKLLKICKIFQEHEWADFK